MKSAFRFCRRVLVDLFFLLVAYIAAVFLLPMIKSDRQADGDADITLYLISNGIHTDIVMPSRNGDTDWTTTFPAADTTGGQSADWIAVGWGDKNFYLNTPTWADLTASTALKAVSGLSESAIHTTYYDSMENCGRCAKFTVSRRQYLELAAYIRSSLKWRDCWHHPRYRRHPLRRKRRLLRGERQLQPLLHLQHLDERRPEKCRREGGIVDDYRRRHLPPLHAVSRAH